MDRRLDAVDWTLAEGRLIRLISYYLRFEKDLKQKAQGKKIGLGILNAYYFYKNALMAASVRKSYLML